MAKNLKLNIKNAQLAEVLKLTQVKKTPVEKEKRKLGPAPEELPPPIVEETPGKSHEEKDIVKEPPTFAAPTIEAKEEVKETIEEAPPPPLRPAAPTQQYERYERQPPRQDYRPPYQRPEGQRPNNFQQRPPQQSYHRPGFSERRPGDFRTPQQARPPGQGFQQRPPGQGFQPRPPGQGFQPYRGPQTGRPFSPRGPMPPRDPPSQRPLPPKAPSSFDTKKVGPKEYRDVKPLNKKNPQERTFDSRDRQGLTDTENEAWRRRRPSQKQKPLIQEEILRPKALSIRLPITVKDLAAEMKLKASQLISRLFMKGVVITLNDFLDDETTVQLLGHDFDCEIKIDVSEEERIRITDKTIKQEIQETDPIRLKIRAPVVTFMGHVDHGKTSLIDTIRKSNRVSTEAGAITQHIGAFRCHTAVGDITILDTPGHEAFSSMRERGADVTDIVVLVVAGDEGLKTQTLEAIEQAKSVSVPIVVAINKSDKPGFNAENVYRQLSENGLLPEKWGGPIITVNCSALTGAGVSELLEMLALQAEVLELRADPENRARGAVIESEMHKGLGAQATVLVQNGSLHSGDAIVFDQHWGRVKTMHDENGKEVQTAGPSTPVKITGLSGLPEAGSEFIIVKSEREARELGEARTLGQKNLLLQQAKKVGIEGLLQKKAETLQKKILNVILRADVQGSLEALKTSLMKIESKKVNLNIISSEVGEISESDIQLASASKATIIGFHTKIESHAESLIKELKVNVRSHDIIYHAVDDVKEIMVGLLDKLAQESDTGMAEVRTTFKASQLGIIAGCQVTQGSIRRNQHIRLLRDGEQIWKGAIASLKRVKEDVREVSKGMECGILLQNFNNVKEGDVIQAFDITYLTQEL